VAGGGSGAAEASASATAGEEEVEGAAAAAEAGRRAPKTLIVADPSATRHTDTGHSSQPLAASAGASDSTYSGADAEEAVAGGGSGAAEASAAATAEEDKRVRALRIALQHRTQMPVTDEEARAILQARGGRETPVTEEEARVILRARGDVGHGRATFQARARGRGGRATASPALASKGGEKLSRRGKKAVAKEAGEVVSREEGEAIYRATLESLLATVHRVDAARRGGDGAKSHVVGRHGAKGGPPIRRRRGKARRRHGGHCVHAHEPPNTTFTRLYACTRTAYACTRASASVRVREASAGQRSNAWACKNFHLAGSEGHGCKNLQEALSRHWARHWRALALTLDLLAACRPPIPHLGCLFSFRCPLSHGPPSVF